MTARNISLLNATYSSVPAVQLPISGGGTATFTEITDTTATASDVATGKYFYTSAGVKTQGTASGNVFTIVIGTGHYPNKTFAEIKSAYDSGKELNVIPNVQPPAMNISWTYNSNVAFIYHIYEPDNNTGEIYGYHYSLNADETRTLISTDITYDTNNANASAGDVLAGKAFYNSSGYAEGTIQTKSSSDLTASGATVTVPSGYYASNASKAVSNGTAGTPTATKGTVSNHTVSVTPSVTNTTGYITGSTKTGTAVTVSASELVSGDKSITANGNNIDVANYSTVSVNVSGGGGESKNAQVVQGTTRTSSSTLTAIGAEMTVTKTGTYDVYWSGYRSTTSGSYTYGTQLYVGGVAYGTQNTTWSNHVQNNHLTNVSLTANQKLRVYGRNSRGSSYYIYAPTLVIIEV